MKEEHVQKGYGGPSKCLYLSLVGRRAFNVETHLSRVELIESIRAR